MSSRAPNPSSPARNTAWSICSQNQVQKHLVLTSPFGMAFSHTALRQPHPAHSRNDPAHCQGRHRVKPLGQLAGVRTPFGHKVQEFPQRHFIRKCQFPGSWPGSSYRGQSPQDQPLSSSKPRGAPPIHLPAQAQESSLAILPLGLHLHGKKPPCTVYSATLHRGQEPCTQFHKHFHELMLCAKFTLQSPSVSFFHSLNQFFFIQNPSRNLTRCSVHA